MTTTTSTTTTSTSGPADPVGTDLTRTLRALKLGGLKDTLPERLALARARKMDNSALELELDDPGIVTDIDTLPDLARAEQLLAGG